MNSSSFSQMTSCKCSIDDNGQLVRPRCPRDAILLNTSHMTDHVSDNKDTFLT